MISTADPAWLQPLRTDRGSRTAEPSEVLAAARLALRVIDAESDRLELRGAPLVSAQSLVYFIGPPGARPLYVAKIVDRSSGAPSARAQHHALQTCATWWRTEDRHHVAAPICLLAKVEGILMRHVSGRSLALILPRLPVRRDEAMVASMAAGDFLRRFHMHSRVGTTEVRLAGLVAAIRDLQAGDFRRLGLSLSEGVERTLALTPDRQAVVSRVTLHGDYAPRNLLLTDGEEIAMLDPILQEDGPAEEDIAFFLAAMSSTPAFAAGLLAPGLRRARQRMQQAFLAAYGLRDVSAPVLWLWLIHTLMERWIYRRTRNVRRPKDRWSALRAALIDAQMAALIGEAATLLDATLAAWPVCGSTVGPITPPS